MRSESHSFTIAESNLTRSAQQIGNIATQQKSVLFNRNIDILTAVQTYCTRLYICMVQGNRHHHHT